MPSISTVIFDNSLSAQNQDYLPNRFVLQKEIIDNLITQTLENDSESLIGLIPLAQKSQNDMLTPTRVKPHLMTFLYRRDLFYEPNCFFALFQAEKSLQICELSEKIVYMFLSIHIEDFDELLTTIYNLASEGVRFYIVCFADALSFGYHLAEQTEAGFPNVSVLSIDNDEGFNRKVERFFANARNNNYMDFDMEMAMKRSMYEK